MRVSVAGAVRKIAITLTIVGSRDAMNDSGRRVAADCRIASFTACLGVAIIKDGKRRHINGRG